MNYDDLISAATDVGYLLLRNGAEIYRVEDSMQRIFRAYGVETGEVFAIPTCIFVTITTPEGKSITKIKRLYTRGTDLDKVDQANDLCRRICRTCPDVSSIHAEVEKINRRPVYDFWTQVAAFAMVAFSFTLFYGGTLPDAFCSLFCGAGVKLVNHFMGRFQANAFFTNIVASCVAATIAMLAVTSFMRDIMGGDLIAGLIRFVESLLVATAIAIGAGIALMVPRLIWGV